LDSQNRAVPYFSSRSRSIFLRLDSFLLFLVIKNMLVVQLELRCRANRSVTANSNCQKESQNLYFVLAISLSHLYDADASAVTIGHEKLTNDFTFSLLVWLKHIFLGHFMGRKYTLVGHYHFETLRKGTYSLHSFGKRSGTLLKITFYLRVRINTFPPSGKR